MVTVLLLVTAILQQDLSVTARVDRTVVEVGDELALTVTVSARGTGVPVEIDDPQLAGLEVRNRRDRTRVTVEEGTPTRVTIREFTLRALQEGAATIGAIRVRRGTDVAETPPIEVRVTARGPSAVAQLSPTARRLLETAEPPALATDAVTVTILTSADTTIIGAQVDVVVAAWFPRSLRTRLRAPPTLEAPSIEGGWIYPQPVPSGVVLSREVDGQPYDLYALHVIVFPLAGGRLTVGPATASYAVPVAGAALSRDVRHDATSDSLWVVVRPQPAPRGVADYRGAIGAGLRLSAEVSDSEIGVGEAAHLNVRLSGRGNVALWPEPEIDWPLGLKVYPQQVEMAVDQQQQGRLGGAKVFEYLVVAESPGAHRVPAPRYAYFDLDEGTYAELVGEAFDLVTPGGAHTVAPLEVVPPLMSDRSPSVSQRLVDRMPGWGWMVIVLTPPLFAVLVRVRPRRRARPRRARRTSGAPTLGVLDARFRNVLDALVPEARVLAGEQLAVALQAAGVEQALAAHTARVRDRLRAALYGPGGAPDPEELTAEALEVLSALAGGIGARERLGSRAVPVVLAFAVVLTGSATSQTAEQLYRADAVRAAADSFALRAGAEPHVAAHWYNLGNALERLGERARARVAWVRAARLAPRDVAIARALELAPSVGSGRVRLTGIVPVTPAEAFMLSALAWVAAWILLAFKRRTRWTWMLGTVAVGVALYGAALVRSYERPVALVLHAATPLREAPYGPAPSDVQLDEASVVLVRRSWGAWRLVRAGEREGWVLANDLEDL